MFLPNGFPATKKQMPSQLEYYWYHGDTPMALDGVVLFTDPVAVPSKL